MRVRRKKKGHRIVASTFLCLCVLYVVTTNFCDKIGQKIRHLIHRSEGYPNDELRTSLIVPINVALNPVLRRFLLAVDVLRLNIVILQPKLLLTFLSAEHLTLLEKRRITPFANERENVFTFGIVDSQEGTTLLVKTLKFLERQGFLGTCGTNHHFLVRSGVLIHLVILKERNNFYYAPAVNSLPSQVAAQFSVDDLFIGKFPTAFERFWIEYVITSPYCFPIPQPLLPFIAYLKMSRFLECNATANETYHRRYPSEPNQKIESSFKAIMPPLKKVFDELVAPFWLASGTLLGWYRQCGIINHTSDIDFAAYLRNDPEKILSEIKENRRKGLIFLKTWGIVERAFEICVTDREMRTDIFFMHEESNYSWYAVHEGNDDSYFQLVFAKYSLCSAELLGLKVLVPCTPQTAIEEEYGSNWMIPDTDWDYEKSSRNIGQHFTWSPEEEKRI